MELPAQGTDVEQLSRASLGGCGVPPATGVVRLICFYLPQFHPIPENDEWWGKGFTEWRNVTRAQPLFAGHYQPHLPADLGFYDLRLPEVREAQAALAAEYGIHGFCYHHYWFNGRRLLQRPFDEVLASGKPDFPFCLSWANENWTRRWDGFDQEVLLEQEHSAEDDRNFIRALLPALRDRRYIRVDGKPLLAVYRTGLLEDPARTAAIWREEVQSALKEDLFLCRVESFVDYPGDNLDPATIGFDAAIEYPPHAMRSRSYLPPKAENAAFDGVVVDYEEIMSNALQRPDPAHKLIRGLIPCWDNTPRRDQRARIVVNSSPDLYGRWLAEALRWTRRHRSGEERLVFVNAWNEWAEGCHLEPDLRYGHRYLAATKAALGERDEIVAALRTCLAGTGSVDDAADAFAAEISATLRENLELRLQSTKDRGPLARFTEIGTESAAVSPAPPPSLRVFLTEYLQTGQRPCPRMRRTLLRAMQALWRLRLVGSQRRV